MLVNQALQLTRKNEKEEGVNYDINEEPDEMTWLEKLKYTKKDSDLMKVRKYVFGVITEPEYNVLAKRVSQIMALVILGSVLEFALETVHSLSVTSDQVMTFLAFELFFNIVFSIDYFGKIFFFPDLKQLPKFLIKPFWLIDLLSILPFYIELMLTAVGGGSSDAAVLRIVRIIRIFRIFRLLKASKNLEQVHLLAKALKDSREAILLMLFLEINLLFLFGSFVFYSEQGISEFNIDEGLWYYTDGMNSGNVSNFQSIPHTMWYLIVTISTVGYGDMFPYSGLSKAIAACSMIIGILLIAFPVTVLSVNFSNVYNEHRVKQAAKVKRNRKDVQSVVQVTKHKKLTKLQSELIRAITEDFIVSTKKVEDVSSKMGSLMEVHADMHLCIYALQNKSLSEKETLFEVGEEVENK